MPIRIGINGFGRIGRRVIRCDPRDPALQIVAVNDLTDPGTLAHLLKYDSVHGRFPGGVAVEKDAIVVAGERIAVTREPEPGRIPWAAQEVDIVLECSGHFAKRAEAVQHVRDSVRKVIVSAPCKDADVTLCCGINLERYEPAAHTVISNASCTTNCLAPLVKVLDDAFGIVHGQMTTVHSYTNDQKILDMPHRDLRRSRSAATNIIPTTTGAARALSEVLPKMEGRLDGVAVRVPTDNVSLVDLVAVLEKSVTRDVVNDAFRAASSGPLRGILGVTDEPLVSSDFNGDRHSGTVDLEATTVTGGKLVKVLAWYDNETGYAQRLYDVTRYVALRGMVG